MNFKGPMGGIVAGVVVSAILTGGFAIYHGMRKQNSELKSQVLRLLFDRDLENYSKSGKRSEGEGLISDDTKKTMERFNLDKE